MCMPPRGFSLIELLVVVAIIGVLSSVVLVSINTARNRGADAAVKENLHTIRNEADLYRDSTGGYGTAAAVQGSPITSAPAYNASGANFLIRDREANNALRSAMNAGGSAYYAIGTGGASYAVAVELKSQTGHWCIDTNGSAKVITTYGLGGGVSAAACP